jgi:hypothetical protein
MSLKGCVRSDKERGESAPRNLAASRFCLRVVLPSLVAIHFLLPSAVRADTISGLLAGTGEETCVGFAITCPGIKVTNISAGVAGFDTVDSNFGSYSGFTPSHGTWDTSGPDDQEYGGCQYTSNCPVFNWRIFFNVPLGQTAVIITGDLAANGPVAIAVDGFGAYAGDFVTAGAFPFTLTVNVNNTSVPGVTCDATESQNYMDYIFTGCTDWPSCSAPPGTPIDDIPESTLLATGGVRPPPACRSPEAYGLCLSAAHYSH